MAAEMSRDSPARKELKYWYVHAIKTKGILYHPC